MFTIQDVLQDEPRGKEIVDRLGKLPSKEQQLSRTQHFILKAHAAIFVLHIQYGPVGTWCKHHIVVPRKLLEAVYIILHSPT